MSSDSLVAISDYDEEGGWETAIGNLVRWLRANSCLDYAHHLERHTQSLGASSPPQVESNALNSILSSLAYVFNQPPKHLTPVQRKEMKMLWRKAREYVNIGIIRCNARKEDYRNAVKGVAKKLSEYQESSDSEAKPCDGSPAGLDEPAVWTSRCGGALICSPDYCTVKRDAEQFSFTPTQRTCMKYMIEAWEKGRQEFSNRELLDEAGSTANYIRDVFRSNGKTIPAWNKLIVEAEGKKGSYTLCLTSTI